MKRLPLIITLSLVAVLALVGLAITRQPDAAPKGPDSTSATRARLADLLTGLESAAKPGKPSAKPITENLPAVASYREFVADFDQNSKSMSWDEVCAFLRTANLDATGEVDLAEALEKARKTYAGLAPGLERLKAENLDDQQKACIETLVSRIDKALDSGDRFVSSARAIRQCVVPVVRRMRDFCRQVEGAKKRFAEPSAAGAAFFDVIRTEVLTAASDLAANKGRLDEIGGLQSIKTELDHDIAALDAQIAAFFHVIPSDLYAAELAAAQVDTVALELFGQTFDSEIEPLSDESTDVMTMMGELILDVVIGIVIDEVVDLVVDFFKWLFSLFGGGDGDGNGDGHGNGNANTQAAGDGTQSGGGQGQGTTSGSGSGTGSGTGKNDHSQTLKGSDPTGVQTAGRLVLTTGMNMASLPGGELATNIGSCQLEGSHRFAAFATPTGFTFLLMDKASGQTLTYEIPEAGNEALLTQLRETARVINVKSTHTDGGMRFFDLIGPDTVNDVVTLVFTDVAGSDGNHRGTLEDTIGLYGKKD